MGTYRPRHLSDLVRFKSNIRAECRCGHVGIVDSTKLSRWFHVHCWNDALVLVPGKLKCSKCLGRPFRVRYTVEPPTGPDWGPKDEWAWGDLVKRLRNR